LFPLIGGKGHRHLVTQTRPAKKIQSRNGVGWDKHRAGHRNQELCYTRKHENGGEIDGGPRLVVTTRLSGEVDISIKCTKIQY